MSRTLTTFILVGTLGLIAGVVTVAALLFGRSLITINGQTTTFPTPVPVIVETHTPGELPTAVSSPTSEPANDGPTAVPTAVPTQAVPTVVPATAIPVSVTSVQYIQAKTDVNIRSGPGTGYSVIGWIGEGQTASVTGVNSDSGWWRVICPDGTTGSCWVTGSSQFTKPANAPGPAPTATVAPTATPSPTVAAACTNIAALVADVTVPDNTQFAPNTGFNKTWRIRNAGTCTWENSYQIVHAGGSQMGAVSTIFPLNQTVAPGQSVDLTLNLVSPATAGTYQSDWKLQSTQGRIFGLGANGSPFFVKIIVTAPAPTTTIAGIVYQDWNENGVYNPGETLMGNREVRLIPGTACHVSSNAVAAVAYSGADGIYTFKGNFAGSYCVALAGSNGLDDVAAVTVTTGQVLTNVNLRSLFSSSSISGFLWNDFCRPSHNGSGFEGNCVADGSGSFRADGMIQPTETYISGVAVSLQTGSCHNNNSVAVSAVTGSSGRYTFSSLLSGTYCVSINATAPGNLQKLLPGGWTFPQVNVWYQEIVLLPGAAAFSVNFGWDYQLD